MEGGTTLSWVPSPAFNTSRAQRAPLKPHHRCVVLLTLYQTGKLRGTVTWFSAQRHTGSQWQSSNLTGVSPTLLTALYPTTHGGQEDK